MAELFAAIVEGIFALIQLILEAVLQLAIASFTIVAYLISPTYRQRKQKAWQGRPIKKSFELGISGICLATLIGFVVWLTYPRSKPPSASPKIEMKQASAEEDARVSLRSEHGDTNAITIAVKKGGVSEILATKSLGDLTKAISNNVTIIKSPKNAGEQPPADFKPETNGLFSPSSRSPEGTKPQ
jgi:hypothetical protein